MTREFEPLGVYCKPCDVKIACHYARFTCAEYEKKYAEFQQYISEWDGDYPDEREGLTFSDWMLT